MVFEPHVRGIKILGVQLVPGKIEAHIVGGYPGGARSQVCIQYSVSPVSRNSAGATCKGRSVFVWGVVAPLFVSYPLGASQTM